MNDTIRGRLADAVDLLADLATFLEWDAGRRLREQRVMKTRDSIYAGACGSNTSQGQTLATPGKMAIGKPWRGVHRVSGWLLTSGHCESVEAVIVHPGRILDSLTAVESR
jgi:hypothetical protein